MKNRSLSQARLMALSAVSVALSVGVMMAIGILPTLRLTAYALLALLPMILSAEGAPDYGLMTWAAATLLGMLLAPDRLLVLPYSLFFGWYGVLYIRLKGRMRRSWAFLIRWLAFNLALGLGLFLAQIFFPGRLTLFWVWLAAGQGGFIIFDWAMDLMLSLYLRRLRKIILGSLGS